MKTTRVTKFKKNFRVIPQVTADGFFKILFPKPRLFDYIIFPSLKFNRKETI